MKLDSASGTSIPLQGTQLVGLYMVTRGWKSQEFQVEAGGSIGHVLPLWASFGSEVGGGQTTIQKGLDNVIAITDRRPGKNLECLSNEHVIELECSSPQNDAHPIAPAAAVAGASYVHLSHWRLSTAPSELATVSSRWLGHRTRDIALSFTAR